MPQITSELLLTKGLPRSTRLWDIKTLNLSGMQLKTNDLDPELFSQMRSLQELNLSGNLLSDIPSDLKLPNLRVLNCADNQLEDVTLLEHLSALEELNYDDNLYMTISDDYKVMCLLPKLRRLNGKDITSSANHVRFVNGRELTNRVSAHWDQNYKNQLPQSFSATHINAVRKDFVKSAMVQIKYGPNSLRDFTKWRVKIIAENFVSSLVEPKENTDAGSEEDTKTANAGVTHKAAKSPRKPNRIVASAFPEESPSKRLCLQPNSAAVSPRTPSRLPSSPRSCAVSPLQPRECKKETTDPLMTKNTPKKSKVTSSPKHGPHDPQQKVIDLEPLHFLQCHSKDNSSKDFTTQLWACAFEPSLDCSSGEGTRSSRTVATCGGESVCIIDCETGHVLKKYKVSGEEFFTLAWTSLTMVAADQQKRKFNVLAAAGLKGVVKLIHTKANFCYGEIKAHQKPIATIAFSTKQETFLFTGSYDKRIILWDIGIPDADYNFNASRLLTLEIDSTPLRMALVPSCPDRYLLAACENGCFAWNITLNTQQGRRQCEVEIQFPIYEKEDKESDYHLVDGLAFLNDDIVASKSAMQGSIYLWSWSQSLKNQKNKRGKKVDAYILAELQWSQTDLPYLMLCSCPEKDYVLCGDEEGRVWMYDVSMCKTKSTSKKVTGPTQILKWPTLSSVGVGKLKGTMINGVTVDPSFGYLVYITDKNIVAIWKIK
ncbi:leucine-rich repeat and WD repeat-containing protein 1 isoform X2 [Pleurodeles waltl]|uniref:leucine-rich repeat and WD repeat-containing protein 1 isoform X2 n=1 Tax=Pleurodeles waltl TaxID=8319 RepID=UPI0037096047